MCGIVGFKKWAGGGTHLNAALTVKARDRMVCRGPDQQGIWIAPDRDCGFGHRRLSVLDLDSRSKQPMIDPVNGNVIVYNGEIYNFRELKREMAGYGCSFRTTSDTEVLLTAYRIWGIACLQKIVGMFAFAIWEQHTNDILLARDRFGVKPLYYSFQDNWFAFASNLSPLIDLGVARDVSQDAVLEFLELGWVAGPETILEGVHKLLPGHWMKVRPNGYSTIHRYWCPKDISLNAAAAGYAPIGLSKVQSTLVDAIESRLVSDVPIGAFLSGGIDSTLVTAIAAQKTDRLLRTFTIGFEDVEYDESRYARRIAEFCGTEHHEILVTAEELQQEIESLFAELDEPMADVAALPTMLLARRAREHVKVCLTGDGGDELFLGYPVHRVQSQLRNVYRIPWSVRRAIGNVIGIMKISKSNLFRGYLCQKDELDGYIYLRSISQAPLTAAGWRARKSLERCTVKDGALSADTRSGLLELGGYLPDALLAKTDLSTMCVSLEAREPLLDHRLAELAFSMPTKQRSQKDILKKVLALYVPRNLWDRRKHAFNVPIGEWLKGPLRRYLSMLESGLPGQTHVAQSYVKEIIDAHLSGRNDHGQLLWSMLVYTNWYHNFLKSQ